MNIEEQWTMAEPIERLEEIPLNGFRLDRTIRIGTLAIFLERTRMYSL